MRLRALAALGDDKLGSREARKESRSLGIFKSVSKSSESPTATPPPPAIPTTVPEEPIKLTTTQPVDSTTSSKPIEKTTKTTATYYPKLTRQDSLIVTRKDSIIPSTISEPSPKEKLTPSSALAGLGKSGYESESGDEFGPGEWNSHQSVALKPYSHQVGGHSALFKFSRHAVCKPLIEKENAFYQDIEINRPERTLPVKPAPQTRWFE